MATRAQIRSHVRNMRKLFKLERKMARKLSKELSQRALKAAEGYEKMEMAGVVLALEGHFKVVLDLMKEQYKEAAEVFGLGLIDELKGIGAAETKDFNTPQFESDIDRYIDSFDTSRLADDISNQTKIRIRNKIHNGIKDGLGVDKIAKNIRGLASRKITNVRSLIIARTETHNAAGFAQDSAARSSGVADMTKTWLTAMDTRVREAHEEQDDVTVDLKSLFGFESDQGSYELMYPGDRNGPPEGIIMCRCFLVYEEPD